MKKLLTLLLIATSVFAQKKPNVILINTDDLGYGDLSCYGATKVQTPHIDKLASEGMRFVDAHSASSVCTPSRYALLTGDYPFKRAGLFAPIFLKDPLVIDTERVTLADVMKQAGYSTAVIGKWHLGFQTKYPVNWNEKLTPGPLDVGFDYFFGLPVVNSHPPYVYVENEQVVGYDPKDPFEYGKKAVTKPYVSKMHLGDIGGAKKAHAMYQDEKVGTVLKDKAIEWMKKEKKNPFFLYFATTNIHHPFTPAPQFKGTSQAGEYGDFIHELDWIVGEVINTVKELGLEDNTMIIFTSDNGGMLNHGGQEAYAMGHKINQDLFGFKFDAWEGGHRVPFIVKWPGEVKPNTVSDELICNVDMLATLAHVVGKPELASSGEDGVNVLPAFKGKNKKPIRENLLITPFRATHVSIRKGNWMYIPDKGNGGFSAVKVGNHTLGGPGATLFTKQQNSDIANGKIKPSAAKGHLYDLKKDPSQQTNVYSKYPEVVAELDAELKAKTEGYIRPEDIAKAKAFGGKNKKGGKGKKGKKGKKKKKH